MNYCAFVIRYLVRLIGGFVKCPWLLPRRETCEFISTLRQVADLTGGWTQDLDDE